MTSQKNLKSDLIHIGVLTGAILGVWSFISGLVEGLTGFVDPNNFDASQALAPIPGLFITSLLNALVLTWFVKKTQLTGIRLALVVFLIIFGVMFFMPQIETLYFLDSVQIPLQIIFGQILSGIGVGLVAGLLTVRYKRKLDSEQNNPKEPFLNPPIKNILGKFVILALIYLVFYFIFGYYIAWQFPDIREYYSGSREILPVLAHMQAQFVNEPNLIGFMTAMNLPKAAPWERMIIVGLAMSIGLALPLVLPQNYMPSGVRFGHFFEVLIENFVFGVVVVVLFGKEIEKLSAMSSA